MDRATDVGALGRGWTGLVAASLLAALAASGWLLLAPTYSTYTTSVGPPVPGAGAADVERSTLLQVNGLVTIPLLLVPVALAALPVVFRRGGPAVLRTSLAALLLATFSILSGFSIGRAYWPAAALMVVAAVVALVWRSVGDGHPSTFPGGASE